ncbi:unnamed protein product [Prorocentrum cordatum]|uniref:Uncharacterized protein n=1 Tax=Prorocentrum cordatum TaxID=2364126 RepID=A0ABN9PIU6_9DINO|nr:unnamed protein product [Polarella glacialis]
MTSSPFEAAPAGFPATRKLGAVGARPPGGARERAHVSGAALAPAPGPGSPSATTRIDSPTRTGLAAWTLPVATASGLFALLLLRFFLGPPRRPLHRSLDNFSLSREASWRGDDSGRLPEATFRRAQPPRRIIDIGRLARHTRFARRASDSTAFCEPQVH